MKKLFIIAVTIFTMNLMLTSCSNYSNIEEEAKPMVDKILQNSYGSNAPDCVAVHITEKVEKNFYKGTAKLTTGNSVNITVLLKGKQIIVTVLND